MNIALLSPKGPLDRNRGGVFETSLRHRPLPATARAASRLARVATAVP